MFVFLEDFSEILVYDVFCETNEYFLLWDNITAYKYFEWSAQNFTSNIMRI